jgi:ParB-like chromosome segregation protein Spo0J
MSQAAPAARKPGKKTKPAPRKAGGGARRKSIGGGADASTPKRGEGLPLNLALGELRKRHGDAQLKLDEFGFADVPRRRELENAAEVLAEEIARKELDEMPPPPSAQLLASVAKFTVSTLDVSEIDVTETNHRERMSGPEVDRLARQVKAAGGLLAPIGVKEDGKRYALIWGSRRLAATMKLGGNLIAARVFPASTTAGQVALLRSIENIGREQLTPVGQCLAVADCLESIEATVTGDNTAAAMDLENAIAQAGTREDYIGSILGRPAEWVRDRMYASRLGGRTRELLSGSRLDLGHARELAKLGDAARADAIAEQAARDVHGLGGKSVAWVREQVLAATRDLSKVPWRLDIAFGLDKPAGCEGWACATCAYNAVTEPGLFGLTLGADGQADEMNAGICTNARCFEVKQAAVEKLVQVGIKAVRKEDKRGSKLDRTITGLSLVTPEPLKPEVFVKEVKREDKANPAEGESESTGAGEGEKLGSKGAEKIDERRAALEKLDAWAKQSARAICKAIDAKPGRALYFAALRNANKLRAMGRTGDAAGERKAQRTATSPETRAILKRWAKPELKDLHALEKQSPHKSEAWVNELSGLVPAALVNIALALGVEVKEAPEVPEGK